MKRALVLVALCLTGCIVTPLRQEALGIVRDRLEKTQTANKQVAEAVRDLVVELQASAKEDRAPDVEEALTSAAAALATANENTNEAGETVAALQDDIGVTPKRAPITRADFEAFLAKYRGIAKLWNMACAWVKGRIPGLAGGAGGATIADAAVAWSPTNIAALVTVIVAGAGTLGVGGKKTVSHLRTRRERRLALSQFEAAIEEFKKAMSDPADKRTFAEIMAPFPATARVHLTRRLAEA